MDDQKTQGFVVRQPQPEWGTDEDRDLHIVLCQPEIPGNSGNIGRLAAGADIWLHLVRPLGYELDNSHLKRAGLDYWPHVKLCVHDAFSEIEDLFPRERIYLFSKKAGRVYTDPAFEPGDVLVFGPETEGLDEALLDAYENRALRIPYSDNVRSLNLSNACAVAVYEALRQNNWNIL